MQDIQFQDPKIVPIPDPPPIIFDDPDFRNHRKEETALGILIYTQERIIAPDGAFKVQTSHGPVWAVLEGEIDLAAHQG